MMLSTSRFAAPASLIGFLLVANLHGDGIKTEGSLFVLSATDELRGAFSFDTGDYAVDIVDGQAVLDRAQIAFHFFAPDKLTTGFVLSEASRVVDLGDLKVDGHFRPSDQAMHPPLSLFHTLFLQGRSFYYRGPIARTYRLKSAEDVFFTLNTSNPTTFTPQIGHIYLLRYVPKKLAGAEEKLVKFRIVDYEPGRQVTIRWARMK